MRRRCPQDMDVEKPAASAMRLGSVFQPEELVNEGASTGRA